MHGANPERQDEKGNSALSIAASTNATNCVRVLVEFGASVTTKNKRGSLPLHKATKRGYFDISKILIEAGSPLDVKDTRLLTPIDYLFTFNQIGLMKQLFEDPVL